MCIIPRISYIEGILPKGPYPPCLRMADRALLAGYLRYIHQCPSWHLSRAEVSLRWHRPQSYRPYPWGVTSELCHFPPTTPDKCFYTASFLPAVCWPRQQVKYTQRKVPASHLQERNSGQPACGKKKTFKGKLQNTQHFTSILFKDECIITLIEQMFQYKYAVHNDNDIRWSRKIHFEVENFHEYSCKTSKQMMLFGENLPYHDDTTLYVKW